jgi:hypothetical protein
MTLDGPSIVKTETETILLAVTLLDRDALDCSLALHPLITQASL